MFKLIYLLSIVHFKSSPLHKIFFFFLYNNFYLNTFLIIYFLFKPFSNFFSGLTHFLRLFTCFSNILDHLPRSRLLSYFSLCTAVCLHSCCFLFLCQWTLILCWFTHLSSSVPFYIYIYRVYLFFLNFYIIIMNYFINK